MASWTLIDDTVLLPKLAGASLCRVHVETASIRTPGAEEPPVRQVTRVGRVAGCAMDSVALSGAHR